MASQSLVSISDALCRINRHAVLHIDKLHIAAGEHWCVFGPNGAGKTLLAALISGRRIESHSYVHYGKSFDPRRDCIFVSFEEQQRLWQRDNRLDMSEYSDRAEDQGTTVTELINSARSTVDHNAAALESLLTQLDLQAIINKGIRFLSSGQVRRALIARALYAASGRDTKLLIFDDPLEAIDKDSRQRIINCIAATQSANYSSLFLCRREQDIPPQASHIAVMDGLRLIAQGEQHSIRSDNAFQAILVRSPALPQQLPDQPTHSKSVALAQQHPNETAHSKSPALPQRLSNEPTYNNPSHTDEKLIELIDVSASYGSQKVLQGVNWVMYASDHVLIEGPNGCGKSTLLSLIDGENHKAYGQEVYLFGKRKGSGETIWETRQKFGVVSNELHNQYRKGWKVLDVVVSGFFDSIGLYDASGAAQRDAANRWLRALGIAGLASHFYHELSFGQQRLTLLARAMVKHPRILILDEPCVGLDDYHRQLILGTLELIANQSATRIIYVSHVTEEYPNFITQKLTFKPASNGGFTLTQQPPP